MLLADVLLPLGPALPPAAGLLPAVVPPAAGLLPAVAPPFAAPEGGVELVEPAATTQCQHTG